MLRNFVALELAEAVSDAGEAAVARVSGNAHSGIGWELSLWRLFFRFFRIHIELWR